MQTFIISALLLASAAPAMGQTADWRLQIVPLVRAAYPDLREASLQIRDLPDGRGVDIAVVTPEPATVERSRPRPPALTVRVTHDQHGVLQRIDFSGPLTRPADREAAAAARAGGAAAVAAVLRGRNARFGPSERAALRAVLPLAALRALFGPGTPSEETFDDLDAHWRIDVARGPGAGYHAIVEPFGGGLVAVVRTGGGQ